MKTKFSVVLIGMVAGLAVNGFAAAATVSYYMSESNKPTFFASGNDYLKVLISDAIADDKIHFTVTPLAALTDLAGTGIGIDKFMFNGPALTQLNIDIAGWEISNDKNDPRKFGPFSNRLANDGAGLGSFPFEFSIDAENDTVDSYAQPYANGSFFFAARVAGFNIGCNGNKSGGGENSEEPGCGHATRAYFSGSALSPPSAIPVPAAAWLFVSGLIGMISVSRPKKL